MITRYLYKPDAAEGMTRFNDNRRLHLFMVDVASGRVEQLTDGAFYEHSVDWSPNGQEIAFLTNRDSDHDEFFNYDVYVMKVADKSIRRLSATESNEYHPRWSPDGRMLAFQATKRGLTDRETTMEDTHAWVVNADGTESPRGGHDRQPPGSARVDAGRPGAAVHGAGTRQRAPVSPADRRRQTRAGGWRARNGRRLLDVKDGAGVHARDAIRSGAVVYRRRRKMTDLNADVLRGRQLAEVESFTFVSNDNKFEVEAFLTKPIGARRGRPGIRSIVNIHGGPHGQQGPAFNFKNQVYAARGWATLMVNYRGSTGYSQAFSDAVFADQNGNEGQDVLYGVSAALRRYPWIDRERLGVEGTSYGGQLSTWLITQTNIFKAAIPTAAITNIISYNYMTYYNQYEAMEWGVYPHQGNLMDTLLQRSSIRHVANAHTPTMLMHGENDNDVPIAEAEQFYIGLKDVGTEAVMVRYPREGHGIRESKHVVDSIDRSIRWYEKHFSRPRS